MPTEVGYLSSYFLTLIITIARYYVRKHVHQIWLRSNENT